MVLFFTAGLARALDYQQYPALVELFELMVNEDNYPAAELAEVFAAVQIDYKVLRAIQRPSERLAWKKYEKLFINNQRINGGVEFHKKYARELSLAQATYGVPSEVVVAILGVETDYGKNLGNISVLNSLSTLTAEFPRRSAFFAKELRAFLNNSRNDGINAKSVVGSYAGAVGIAQFMPTSYSAYAVDFNHNGKRDLSFEPADAIGSAANYLKIHGWVAGRRIFVNINTPLSAAAQALISKRATPKHTAAQLQAAGIEIQNHYADEKMAVVNLRGGNRHIIAFRNFYSITRYNPSINYAMAVVELSAQIREKLGNK